MNDEHEFPEEDLGPPAIELQRLREVPSENFLARLRGRIGRREAAGTWLDFCVQVFGAVVVEFLDMLFSLFPRSGPGRR